MAAKRNYWLLGLILAAAAGAASFAARWYTARPLSLAARLQHLPRRDAVTIYIDFRRLRQAGILDLAASSKIPEDADYREFARKIDLDWKRDLDSALLALAPSGKYMLVEGRFDWPRLRAYALASGGECFQSACRMEGSQPGRRISFLPLQDRLMALAVSTDEWAVRNLEGRSPGPQDDLPDAPLWVRIPGTALKSADSLPGGTRPFASSIAQADFATLMLAPEHQSISARLDVRCADAGDAAAIAGELSRATSALRDMIAREHHEPNPADLSGLLAAGSFWSQGARVYGRWPIERALVANLLGGV